MIFQKRMSIAHSVMLLVTLLFVLTTRGVTIDFSQAARTAAHGNFSTPMASIKRSHARSNSETTPISAEYMLTPTTLLNATGRSRRALVIQQARSAPASPAGTLRGWGTPQNRHRAASKNSATSDSAELEGSQVDVYSDDELSEDARYVSMSGNETDTLDYPTPSSVAD